MSSDVCVVRYCTEASIMQGPLQRMVAEFPHVFEVCVGHTTRDVSTYMTSGKVENEEDGVAYHFVHAEHFERMKNKGEFVQTCTLFANQFGVTHNAIETVAMKNMACVLTMELEGIMSFKRTHFKPRCILLVPQNTQAYKDRLHNANRYSESEISESVRKVNIYMEMNQREPGYFDATVVSDDVDDAYSQLKYVVESYLDITPPNTAKESRNCEKVHRNSYKLSIFYYFYFPKLLYLLLSIQTLYSKPCSECVSIGWYW